MMDAHNTHIYKCVRIWSGHYAGRHSSAGAGQKCSVKNSLKSAVKVKSDCMYGC